MALNLGNNFKVSARKQHELPGNQRVLSQRIGHKITSESPPKLETVPHTFSVGGWARKTARKTKSSNPLSQTTIDEIYRKSDDNDDEETKFLQHRGLHLDTRL